MVARKQGPSRPGATLYSLSLILLLVGVLSGSTCSLGGGPTVVASAITVGYGDGMSLQLDPESPEFQQISSEAIRLVQAAVIGLEGICFEERMAEKKQQCKYVHLDFDPPAPVSISRALKQSYSSSEHITSMVLFFNDPEGRDPQHLICVEIIEGAGYGFFESTRSYSGLEKMVDSLDQ